MGEVHSHKDEKTNLPIVAQRKTKSVPHSPCIFSLPSPLCRFPVVTPVTPDRPPKPPQPSPCPHTRSRIPSLPTPKSLVPLSVAVATAQRKSAAHTRTSSAVNLSTPNLHAETNTNNNITPTPTTAQPQNQHQHYDHEDRILRQYITNTTNHHHHRHHASRRCGACPHHLRRGLRLRLPGRPHPTLLHASPLPLRRLPRPQPCLAGPFSGYRARPHGRWAPRCCVCRWGVGGPGAGGEGLAPGC